MTPETQLEHDLLTEILNTSESGVVLLDRSEIILYASSAATQLLKTGPLIGTVFPAAAANTAQDLSFRRVPSSFDRTIVWIRHEHAPPSGLSWQADAVIHSITEGVIVSDCAGNVLSMNPAGLAIHGFENVAESRRNVNDYPDFSLFRKGEIVPVSQWPLARVLKGETLLNEEYEARRANRTQAMYWSYSGALARNAAGTALFAVLTMRDVTSQRHMERELSTTEERQLLAVEAADMGVFSHDLLTGHLYFSRRAKRHFGFDPTQEISRQNVTDAMHPSDRERAGELRREAIRTRADYVAEYRVVHRDGTERWIAAQGRATYNTSGVPIAMQGVLLDISARKHAEEALRQSTHALRSVIEACPLAIFTVDADALVRTWNTSATTLFGWTEEEVLGRPVPIVPHASEQQHREFLRLARQGQAISGVERQAVTKDGRQRTVNVSVAPLYSPSSLAEGVVCVVEDVTERRQLEQQFQHAQKLESLGVLAGGVAHDFNNLLTGILGNASLVMDGMPPTDPNHEMLSDVVRASERAADLTRQLLAYAGKGRFVTRPIQLSLLVAEISSLIHATLPRKVHVMRDLPPNLPLMEADPSQIQQIVMNLVINAGEAIGADSPGCILVSTSLVQATAETVRGYFNAEAVTGGPHVALEVHDTGCGMDESTLSRIFDPFFSTKFTGRGLGLSAVLGIVRSQKGALRVTSRPAGGTSFTILFPVTEQPAPSQAPPEAPLPIAFSEREALNFPPPALVVLEERICEEAAVRIRKLRPSLPILVAIEDHPVDAMRRHPHLRVDGFLQKPYLPSDLQRKARQIGTSV